MLTFVLTEFTRVETIARTHTIAASAVARACTGVASGSCGHQDTMAKIDY